ncbi:discoidin domain-containing protein [Streptomyces sp. NPDC005009]
MSYWEGPAGAFPQWIRVDLGGTVEAEQVVLELPTGWEARTQTLSVEGSTDGSSFTALSGSAAHRFDPDGGNTVTVDFPARDVRHIRVRVSADTGWNAPSRRRSRSTATTTAIRRNHRSTAPTCRSGSRSKPPPQFTRSWRPTPTTGSWTPPGSPAATPPPSRSHWVPTRTSAVSSSSSTPTPSGRSGPRASKSSAGNGRRTASPR